MHGYVVGSISVQPCSHTWMPTFCACADLLALYCFARDSSGALPWGCKYLSSVGAYDVYDSQLVLQSLPEEWR